MAVDAVSAAETIEQLRDAQIRLRNNRRLLAAMRSSRLPSVKTPAQFDFAFHPSIKRQQIENLHQLGSVDQGENLISLKPPEVGKTHLAITAAHPARRLYHGTLAGLIDSLMEPKAAGKLSPRLRVLTAPALLVVDESRCLPLTHHRAVLFFQLINPRPEHASTVLTSNKGFEEWGSLLRDQVRAADLIHPLLRHCHILNIRGNGYKMRQHRNLLQPASETAPPKIAL